MPTDPVPAKRSRRTSTAALASESTPPVAVDQPGAVGVSEPADRRDPSSRPLILLDGMSLAFRAYFALPPDLATSAGVVTNAVHGFTSMVVNLVRDHRPIGLAVAFDLPGGTFRDDIIEDYKGGRSETPPDLPPQFDMIRTVLESLAIPVLTSEGYEADDVLATLATEARDRGHPVIIVTGDRDSYQLVEDPYVRVLYNRRGVSDYALYDEAGIAERTGVPPDKYPLLAALRGDPSDNLPGVPGVGEKTAAKLVNEYGDLDALFGHLDALSPKLRENLAAHLERVRKNAEVIPLVRDVPLDVHIDQLVLGGWDLETAHQVFAELELRQLWTRCTTLMVEGAFGEPAPGSSRPAGAVVGTAPTDQSTGDQPPWLARPEASVPSDATSAVSQVRDLVAGAREASVALALYARWAGDPGRSPLVSSTLAAEPHPAGSESDPQASTQIVHLGRGAGGEMLLDDRTVLEALAAELGGDGVEVVAHDAKELMRTLLPLGIDITGLVLDTAVGAYLLDPSTDSYRVSDLAARFLGVEVDDGTGPKGQGTFALDDGEGDGTTEPSGLEPAVVEPVRLAVVLGPPATPHAGRPRRGGRE